jgi:hypothetical protein
VGGGDRSRLQLAKISDSAARPPHHHGLRWRRSATSPEGTHFQIESVDDAILPAAQVAPTTKWIGSRRQISWVPRIPLARACERNATVFAARRAGRARCLPGSWSLRAARLGV